MPSLRSLSSFAGGLLSQIPLLSQPQQPVSISSPQSQSPFPPVNSVGPGVGASNFEHICPINSPTSCHNSTAFPDSCCFIYPGGQLLQTQFWDTGPSIGPSDSWTLHGLWPDLCDGSYPTFCTQAPMYHNITAILSSSSSSLSTSSNEPSLLDYMKTYWLPNRGSPDSFWEHEWNKHGTCINTLAPSCYSAYTPGSEVVDFFTRAVALFKELDTYKALAAKGIVPVWGKTYTRAEILDALKAVTGQEVVIGCRGRVINQAWYSFNVKGSLQGGEFIATEPVGKSGRGGCPETGIRYLPK
ncbi:ribonuclease T2 family protein [Diplocarpon rosae]|nr:ribonuclease T2 family protein [Diplocarpon rosae]